MDNEGLSLFQGTDIQINNSKNIEEEEDLEDQLRRKEELQNLLQANLDDFNYDDSTINSSTNTSVLSNDNLNHLYKEALTPDEQLKVLYEVRCREIQTLKHDFDKVKVEKNKEIEALKKQNLLLEGEIRQFQISLKNSGNLLVDKSETVNTLTKTLEQKEGQIDKLKEIVANHEADLMAYKSEVAELHVKLQSQKGLLNLDAKYNSEELKKSLENQIEQLQGTLEAEVNKFKICSNEKNALRDEVERLVSEKIALENDNMAIFKSFEDAQKQCKNLIEVVEVVKNENDHFRARLNDQLQKDPNSLLNTSLDNNQNTERLKKMLVDKSVELDGLKVKLRFYESDLRDLTEYRQLKGEVSKKEFKSCNNPSHTKDLLLLQNELKNYKTLIEDKNRQISSLHSNNKDLKERIEEMLVQTRSEIQNISLKYNLPQLELMKQELEKTECNERRLQKKLEESEERRLSLLKSLENQSNKDNTEALLNEVEKCRSDLKVANQLLAKEQEENRRLSAELEYKKNELFQLKSELEETRLQHKKLQSTLELENGPVKSDYEALKLQLKNVMQHLENKSNREAPEKALEIAFQMDKFLQEVQGDTVEKGIVEEKFNSWKKLLQQIEVNSDEVLKRQYKEAVIRIKELEEILQDSKNRVTTMQSEKQDLDSRLKDCMEQLEGAAMARVLLEKTVDELRQKIHDSNELKSKEEDLVKALEIIKRYEQEKKETKRWLDKVKKEMEKLKGEKAKLIEQLKETENATREGRLVGPSGAGGDTEERKKENQLQTAIEEEAVKRELNLRDELQIEYQKRISDIEKMYQKMFKDTNDIRKQQKAELEEQDKKFREYLKKILNECDACTSRLEDEKLELAGQLKMLRTDFDKYKESTVAQEQKFIALIKKLEKDSRKNHEAWKEYSKKVVCSCLDIEATNKKVRDRLLENMDRYDQKVKDIQILMDAKLARKVKSKEGKL
ncbi:putative leucine-rich repeat-containing protein DDB_G0290503 [Euwallacea similis]|uniref:putative leucine-rich repeat-containing protein DDB_G0290503 n=1 Tax=Euwallacea similis TaxID=1736056 RepID=UPI00344C4DEC